MGVGIPDWPVHYWLAAVSLGFFCCVIACCVVYAIARKKRKKLIQLKKAKYARNARMSTRTIGRLAPDAPSRLCSDGCQNIKTAECGFCRQRIARCLDCYKVWSSCACDEQENKRQRAEGIEEQYQEQRDYQRHERSHVSKETFEKQYWQTLENGESSTFTQMLMGHVPESDIIEKKVPHQVMDEKKGQEQWRRNQMAEKELELKLQKKIDRAVDRDKKRKPSIQRAKVRDSRVPSTKMKAEVQLDRIRNALGQLIRTHQRGESTRSRNFECTLCRVPDDYDPQQIPELDQVTTADITSERDTVSLERELERRKAYHKARMNQKNDSVGSRSAQVTGITPITAIANRLGLPIHG